MNSSLNYPRLLLGGRQPLCGIGVTSVIDLISNPAVCKLLTAVSFPAPKPLVNTSTLFIPAATASLPAASARSRRHHHLRNPRHKDAQGLRPHPLDRGRPHCQVRSSERNRLHLERVRSLAAGG